jgi:predicted nuclease with TOPRIM domain
MSKLEAQMRARFHEAAAELAALRERATPHRAAYEAKRNELMERERTELKPLEEAMKAAEAGAFELQQEIAMLSRALGGKTGPAPE